MSLFYKPIKTLVLKCRENNRETKKNHLDKQLWLFVKDSGANRVQICSTFTFTCKIVLTELEKVRLASRVSSALSYVVQTLWSERGLPGCNGGQFGPKYLKTVWPRCTWKWLLCTSVQSEMTLQKLYLLKSVGGLNCHDAFKYLALNHSCPLICTFAAGQQEHPWN